MQIYISSLSMVEANSHCQSQTTTKTYQKLVKNEETLSQVLPSQRLSKSVVCSILELQIGSQDCLMLYYRISQTSLAQYVGGLKYPIQDKIPIHNIFELVDAINMTEMIERPHPTHLDFSQPSQAPMCMKIASLIHLLSIKKLRENDHYLRLHQGNQKFHLTPMANPKQKPLCFTCSFRTKNEWRVQNVCLYLSHQQNYNQIQILDLLDELIGATIFF